METWKAWCKENNDLISCVDPKGGFTAFPKYRNRIGSSKFAEKLLKEEKVLVCPGDQFGIEKHLRINLGTKGDTLLQGLERITRFMRRQIK